MLCQEFFFDTTDSRPIKTDNQRLALKNIAQAFDYAKSQ